MTKSDEAAMRLFVALPAPPPVADELECWTREQKKRLSFRKWTHPRDYHLTLQFLGDVPVSRAEELAGALRTVQTGPIRLELGGIGTFGQPSAPRVLWASVTGDLERLTALHKAVTEATAPLGFEAESRPYAPHITLARGFAGGSPEGGFGELAAPSGAGWVADRFVLMRTHMHQSPMYEVIGEFPLAGE
ncbi:RNA 2',3'-cyclic phosphodiesterase [Paenibacillus sp. N4]|uniref:RNA 2',3'-cyclic phosphodiesterase n=1 Tax=Paenibacillus vietnamensis TaxID=2590547 RepID=UPI001CD0737B|nr:RNA 2',3'-cyclic phosphodiesterase [Paenibacillus vietnamensis]MCA0758175.1 RNA 2',3'-cyclic phosphodiesterase [Paenibacillus vietnamensis]